VLSARRMVKPSSTPLWRRLWLDAIVLAIGAVEFWRTASTDYAVVLAPEGVAASSVNYEAFIAPVCLWLGGVLLSARLLGVGLSRGRRALSRLLSPIARSLSGAVAGSLSRRKGLMTQGTVMVALAVAFAASTAVFDATYNAQSRMDDGVLVSEETRVTYQLNPGDPLNLRLQSAKDLQYHTVKFHVVGVVREFPTAPKDSFLVVNSSYLVRETATDSAETVLMRVMGDRNAVARRARAVVADIPGAKVTDLGSVQRAISSSLTAVSLQGLTRLELAFAVLLAAGAAGLILGLGLLERQKMFAILKGLGADTRQLGAFLWSEALFMLVPGIVIGGLLGLGVAQVLVKMLTGIFDPPPETLTIPWLYLAILCIAAFASTVAAVVMLRIYSRRRVLETLRGL